MDSNHDIVPTLRLNGGVYMSFAADEIERLRARVAVLERRADTSLIPGAAPTHRCKVCGAWWRKWNVDGESSWNLCSRGCGECCDNALMGEQIEALASPAKVPDAVMQALDRMSTPLHDSRLSGLTAELDAANIKTIRDYVLSGTVPAKVNVGLHPAIREGVEAAFEGRDGWQTKIAAAARHLPTEDAKVGGDEREAFIDKCIRLLEASRHAAGVVGAEHIEAFPYLPEYDEAVEWLKENRAALSADGGEVKARATTVHRRIDALCEAANTPGANYFDASTSMLIATRDLLTAIGHPHAMDIAANQAKGDA